MKTFILIFFLLCFFVDVSFAASMCNATFYDKDGGCFRKIVCREVDEASCSTSGGVITQDMVVCAYSCAACSLTNYCNPESLCNLFANSVGGCNDTPMYCSTSPVYQRVSAFLGTIENASRWTYYSTIGKDNNTYKCVLSYTRPSGATVIVIAGTALSSHDPVGSPWCLNDAEYNALVNTNCDLSSGWTVNSGYITNYRDGTAPTQNPDTSEGAVVPTGSTPVGPSGQPIDSPTGFDGNKDGFDDVTGQPLPFSPGTGGDEVTIKDPEPSAIPSVPSGGEYDTDIESPEQKPLSELFDVIDSSPFISVLQGTRMELSASQCLLSTSGTVFGHSVSFNFCDSRIVNALDFIGVIIVGIAAILAILLIFV